MGNLISIIVLDRIIRSSKTMKSEPVIVDGPTFSPAVSLALCLASLALDAIKKKD